MQNVITQRETTNIFSVLDVTNERSLFSEDLSFSTSLRSNKTEFLKAVVRKSSSKYCKIFNNNFFYRTLPVAASESFKVVYNRERMLSI